MTSSNYYEPQLDDLQFPKVFTNNYFGSDENNLDEYDNIDCELLLEFFGTDNTGGQRGGYDTGSYNKHSSTFPACSEDVLSPSLRNELSSTLEDDDKKTEPTKVSFENAMIKKEEMNGPAPKAKKQKISDGQQSSRTPFPAQQNQEQFASEKGESLQHSKVAITSKNSTSKIIQLEASKDRRRERNKVLARKTRCKKKAEFETLRKQLLKLRTENDRLKELVKGTLPTAVNAETLLECDVQLPEDIAKVVQAMIHAIEAADSSIQALAKPSQRSFCVTNAIAADNPIVYASPGFMELTGYDMHGILGHNCRLLQGEDTDKNEVRKLRLAIEQGREEQVVMKNYRKNGSSFWSRVQIAPMRDSSGSVALIVCVQYEVSGPSSQPFTTAISVDKSGVRKSKGDAFDTAAPSATESAPSSSTEGTQISSSNSCASFADDRSGSYNGSTTGGGSSSSSGYSSNDNRSSDGVSDQGDSN